MIGLAVAFNTHTNDFACNSYVQSCLTASPAEQAAAKRAVCYMIAGLGAVAAVAGTVVISTGRK